MYSRSPLFARVFALFLYRYLLRGGFQDGREGLIFFVLQAWYRFLVDAKLYEHTLDQRRNGIAAEDISMEGSEEKTLNRSQPIPVVDEAIAEK
jgi:hypothetical protein